MPKFVPSFDLPDDIDDFTRGYIICAEFTDEPLWDGHDNEEIDRPEPENWSSEFLARAKDDCADFQDYAAADAPAKTRQQSAPPSVPELKPCLMKSKTPGRNAKTWPQPTSGAASMKIFNAHSMKAPGNR